MAARRSGANAFSLSAAALMALAGTPTLSAATTWPLRDSSGTASEHNPTSICRSAIAYPCIRTLAISCRNPGKSHSVCGV